MKYEHKAIIDAATREGKSPMEKAKELLGHDLLKSMVTTISGHAVAFKNMTEQQQDSAIAQMQEAVKSAVDTAVRVIASQATKTVRMKLKSVAIGKKWKIVGEAEGDEEFLHELADKTQDQSDVLVLLYERDYLQGLDAIQGEKDQKSLPLGKDESAAETTPKARGKAQAKKGQTVADIAAAIVLDPALIDKASKFVAEYRTPTVAGIQNLLSIGFQKAEAVLADLARKGEILIADDGSYSMPPLAEPKPSNKAKANYKVKADEAASTAEAQAAIDAEQDASDDQATELTDELYEAIKTRVIDKQSVALIAITLAHNVTDEVGLEAIDRLEMDGVISDEDEMGSRTIFEQTLIS